MQTVGFYPWCNHLKSDKQRNSSLSSSKFVKNVTAILENNNQHDSRVEKCFCYDKYILFIKKKKKIYVKCLDDLITGAVSSCSLFTAPHSSRPCTVSWCFLISCIDKKKTSESSLLTSCSARGSARKGTCFLFLMTLVGFPLKEKAEQCYTICVLTQTNVCSSHKIQSKFWESSTPPHLVERWWRGLHIFHWLMGQTKRAV